MYVFPIEYKVRTGDTLFNGNTGGLQYSNYRVTLHANTYTALVGGTESPSSNAEAYLVYTNAHVVPEVIE